MRILVESMYDISLKDNDKILWNISPDKEKRISFEEASNITQSDSYIPSDNLGSNSISKQTKKE